MRFCMGKSLEKSHYRVIIAFFLIPTVMLIIGYILFPYPPLLFEKQLSFIPLFLGLIFLGAGFFYPSKNTASVLKILGWGLLCSFWVTMPNYLYLSEEGDFFNASVCIIGVYILFYLAYHEWLSIQRNDHVHCLNWIAGSAFLAGIIYFSIENSIIPGLKEWLIVNVAMHTADLLHIFGINVIRNQDLIIYNNIPITIIFACTAIQSIVLFIGMISTLSNANIKRRTLALLVTVIPIYILNLIRNASVVFMVGSEMVSFELAHNVIGKTGSLLALIFLLFVVFKITPELYDEIFCIINLTKRRGPVELFFIKLMGKKK